jgi:lysophospholipid acyltransferase
MLKGLSDAIGMPVDQFNFIVAELAMLVMGLILRLLIVPCPQNAFMRHLVFSLIGICVVFFSHGILIWHLFFQAIVTILAFRFIPRKYIHIFITCFAMGHLTLLHAHRVFFDFSSHTLDVTSIIMVSTQKLTSLVFSYYDYTKLNKDLSDEQKMYLIE